MILYIYAALAYASTPYMTGEHGVSWMTTTALTLRVYALMELRGKRFCCVCCDSSEFPSFSCSRSDVYSCVYVCYHYTLTLTHFRVFSCDFPTATDRLRGKRINARRLSRRPSANEENQCLCLPKTNTRELYHLLL